MVFRFEPRALSTRRQAMDNLFNEFPLPFRLWNDVGAEEIPVDVYQNEKDIVIKASLPGVKPEDVDIHVTGDTLVIKGEVMAEAEVKEGDFLVKERRYGEFRRSLTLPVGVKADKAQAVFENGLLTLTLPKDQPEGPTKIKISTKKAA